MNKNISFITCASAKTGLGHLVRSLSLAKMLDGRFNISFVINSADSAITSIITAYGYDVKTVENPSHINSFELLKPLISQAHIIVLDFYTVTDKLQLDIKSNNFRLVCIDDLHQNNFYADVIINVSASVTNADYRCQPYTKLLLGTSYALLRPEFVQSALKQSRNIEDVNAVFVNMGGSDMQNNTLKFLKALTCLKTLKNIYVVLGVANPHQSAILDFIKTIDEKALISVYINISALKLTQLLFMCQLAICPASGISVELSAVGIGMISGYTVDNQKDMLQGLAESNCAFNLDDFNVLSVKQITEAIIQIIPQIQVINQMIKNQKKMIDGQSPTRLINVFEFL